MKTPILALALVLALALPLFAAEKADLTLNDGRVLKAARIVTIGEKQVMIVHAGGALGVPPETVPLDVLARAKMELDAENKTPPQDMAAIELLARQSDRAKSEEEALKLDAKVRAALIDVTIDAGITIIQALPEGVLAKGHGFRGKVIATPVKHSQWVQDTGLNAHKKVLKTWTEWSYNRASAGLPDIFFVKMKPAGLADGDSLGVVMWELGTQTYTSVLGARKTVRSYTTDFREYLRGLHPSEPESKATKARHKF